MSEYGSMGDAGDPTEPDGFVPPATPPSTPHDAGGAASPFDVTPADGDVIGSNERKPVRRAPALLAMVAVLVVVLAGGALAFVRSSSPTSSALVKMVPAGSYGYIQIDLKQSSSAGLYEYLTHFPGSPATKPDAHKATFRDTLLSTVFSKSDQINYNRDVQPWLGNSAGIAVFRGSNGDPVPLVVLATTDAAKAKAGLARIRKSDTTFAYDITDGDVLLAQKQADLDEAVSQAKAGALPSSPNYAADVATLPSGSLVTMWADLDKITAAAKSAISKTCASGSAISGCSAIGGLTNLGALGSLGGAATSGGRIALGVTVADKVATLTVRELGHNSAKSTATVGTEIKQLPADTTGAIALGDVSGGITAAMKSLGSLSGLLGAGLDAELPVGAAASYAAGATYMAGPSSAAGATTAVVSPAPLPVPLPSAGTVISGDSAPSMSPAMMATLKAEMASAEAADPSAFPSGLPSAAAGLSGMQMLTNESGAASDPLAMITREIKTATGLTFPGDVTALLGDRSVISVGDIPLSTSSIKDLQVGIRSHPKDLAKAQSLAQTLGQHLSASGVPFQLGTKTAGGDFVLASSQGYADSLAATGTLGSNPQFTAAMGDLSAANFAAYVDLSKFTGILSATKDKVFSGFKGLGIVERTDGSGAVVQIKLIAG